MASLGENFRTFTIGSTSIASLFTAAGATIADAGRVHQTFSSTAHSPRIYLRRSNSVQDLALDGSGGLVTSQWDVEVYGQDEDNAIDIADAVKARLDGYRGTFGAGTVQAIFVTDHDDDYEWKGAGTSTGFYSAALSVQIFSGG